MSSHLHELVAPYALDALDDDERERFEQHLAGCERCLVQLAELQEGVVALAYAAEGPHPPASLRERVLESARPDGKARVLTFPRRRWAFPAVAGIAAAAACVAIGLGLWAASLSDSLERERSAKASYARALQLLGGGAEVKALNETEGALLVRRAEAALVVCDLSSAPSGKTYEAWVIEDGTPSPAGLFRGGSGCTPFLLERAVPAGASVAVTLERKGGVQKPTGRILVQSEAV
jgi:anti-sigma factor RsiW